MVFGALVGRLRLGAPGEARLAGVDAGRSGAVDADVIGRETLTHSVLAFVGDHAVDHIGNVDSGGRWRRGTGEGSGTLHGSGRGEARCALRHGRGSGRTVGEQIGNDSGGGEAFVLGAQKRFEVALVRALAFRRSEGGGPGFFVQSIGRRRLADGAKHGDTPIK